jgi:hypothetical protein
MPYIVLRGRWCQVIALNVHAPTEDKTDDVKDSFYEELERMFIHGTLLKLSKFFCFVTGYSYNIRIFSMLRQRHVVL